MKDSDRKVLGDLSQKILDNCISEDDMEYFRLQDDTSLMQKTFFDLWGSCKLSHYSKLNFLS